MDKYFAFRIGNDKSGKYRCWTSADVPYGTFKNCNLAELNDLREVAISQGMSVYYFDIDVDLVEDAQLLAPTDPTPEDL